MKPNYFCSIQLYVLLTVFFLLPLTACKEDTDSTISSTSSPSTELKGISLDIRNPYGRMKYHDGYIYLSGASQLLANSDGTEVTEWGGVQRINTATYEKDVVIHQGHRVSDVAVVSATQAYLIEYLDWGNSALKRFNPTSGEVADGNVAELGDGAGGAWGTVNLIALAVDKNGKLWVTCSTTGDTNVYVIDTTTDTVEERVDTGLAPQYLNFCQDKAIVVTSTLTYSAGAHSIIPIEQTGGARTPVNNLTADVSDLAVNVFGDYFYRIQRYQSDTIMKFHIDSPGNVRADVNTADPDVIWQYSAMDSSDITNEDLSSTNPHALVIYSQTRGFLLRYESRYAWIVNPSATSQSEFKSGTLDLSAYGDTDGIPEMTDGIIVGEKLFIAMQRLYRDTDNIWKTSSPSYVAVYNAETGVEIDTRD